MGKNHLLYYQFSKDYMHASDVMLFLKISRSTLHRMCNNGQIPYTQLGKVRLFPVEVIHKLLQHNLQNYPLQDTEPSQTEDQ
ncbi:helix-turn-helix domain-containing protein [Paucihalobacter ruber]|uniref:Helix-turn-helix domain-containing protein n=1 Tax=Paucihalobacter ruber TaxID=2567861 RepID=A0A506PFX8_9FLAO|nr:helix-turn-helix domain-containing protein [Paucihalobacter ruber]TPV32746.1 helix-turn-helix domain-containing protein [Paucihalobacter ruber]